MAVDIKVSPDEKIELVQTYITDTNPNSDYFNISELPDTFSGGKNAFLIAGTAKLLANTEIKIQIRDSAGNVCYVEYANGAIPIYDEKNPSKVLYYSEYYEGNSKVVAVYVYPTTTAFGPATITILGQLKDVPQEWNGLYSVKWQRQININPALPNTTRVRFYKRPAVSITEIVEPLYTIVSGSKTPSLIQGSFASIKVNQLETFAGDVKRIKVYRTAQGDISDYDLIQDILVESKNLLTTYALSGSVVGNGGLFTNDSLSKLWKTGSLHAVLDSTHVEDGLQLTGSGTLTYSSSLNLLSSNTYELELDSYFTGSANSSSSNLGIYLSYPTQSLITDKNPTPQPYTLNTTIAILSGSIPAKKFGTQTFPFNITNDYPSASLYLSQSSGTTQWHVGNISLNVSQDTAFSPNEISFVTSMPTVLTNETFNFKFEFYDVNNNYVPVAVTQSALFVGGTNFNTLQSGSLYTSASLTALSQSVSGTIGIVTGSVAFVSTSVSSSLSQSFGFTSAASASLQSSSLYISASLSSSISSSISTSVAFASQSVYNGLSSSYARVQQLADGGYSGSFISGNIIYAPVVGGQLGYFSTLFRVGQEPNSIYLDARTSTRKIYIGGINSTGSYNSGSTTVYMDSSGKFSLGNQMAWDGTSLTVNGTINVTGGNAATQDYAGSTASGSLTAATTRLNASSSVLQSSITGVDDKVFTNALGRITKTPSLGSTAGLYLGSANLGYYNGTAWKTYMDNTGLFYLTGSAGGNALLWDGSTLTIKGNLAVGSVVPNSAVSGLGSLALSSSVSTAQVTGLGALAIKDNITLSYVTNAGSLAALSSISAAQIDASAVTNAKLATDAVTEGKLAADAVTSGKISANAVVADKIAANAIVADKIAAGAITAAKISAGAIEADKIAAGAITAAKIAAGAITADKISVSDLSALNATIGGWNITTTGIESTDTFTRMRSDNKEFAVMDSNNVNYYKVRIGAGNTFKNQSFHPFSEINESGIRVGGIVDTNGNVLSATLQGYNDTANSNTGVSVAVYSSFNYSYNQYVPIYARVITNNSGVASGNAAGEFVGGITVRNDTTPLAADSVNQGFAIISQGHNYFGSGGTGTTQIANPFFALSDVYLRGLALNPSGAGTNYTIKADTVSNGKLFQSSSSRKTKNIYGNWKIGGVLENIKKVPVKRFKYKNWADDEVETFGLIAEDLHNNDFWQSVIYDADKNNKAIYTEETVAGIDYEKVTSILWKGMQELLQRVEDLETQLKNK